MATKRKVKKVAKKEYIVIRDVYERYGSGGRKTKVVKAASLVDLLAQDFMWLVDDYEPIDKANLALLRKEKTDKEILADWDMSNGDGMDFIEVIDKKTGRVVFGGDRL